MFSALCIEFIYYICENIKIIEMKEEIKKYLRLNGKTQYFICKILNLSQPSVSAKINGRQPWYDFELDILRDYEIIS